MKAQLGICRTTQEGRLSGDDRVCEGDIDCRIVSRVQLKNGTTIQKSERCILFWRPGLDCIKVMCVGRTWWFSAHSQSPLLGDGTFRLMKPQVRHRCVSGASSQAPPAYFATACSISHSLHAGAPAEENEKILLSKTKNAGTHARTTRSQVCRCDLLYLYSVTNKSEDYHPISFKPGLHVRVVHLFRLFASLFVLPF